MTWYLVIYELAACNDSCTNVKHRPSAFRNVSHILMNDLGTCKRAQLAMYCSSDWNHDCVKSLWKCSGQSAHSTHGSELYPTRRNVSTTQRKRPVCDEQWGVFMIAIRDNVYSFEGVAMSTLLCISNQDSLMPSLQKLVVYTMFELAIAISVDSMNIHMDTAGEMHKLSNWTESFIFKTAFVKDRTWAATCYNNRDNFNLNKSKILISSPCSPQMPGLPLILDGVQIVWTLYHENPITSSE